MLNLDKLQQLHILNRTLHFCSFSTRARCSLCLPSLRNIYAGALLQHGDEYSIRSFFDTVFSRLASTSLSTYTQMVTCCLEEKDRISLHSFNKYTSFGIVISCLKCINATPISNNNNRQRTRYLSRPLFHEHLGHVPTYLGRYIRAKPLSQRQSAEKAKEASEG